MKIMVSGHRKVKIIGYSQAFIRESIHEYLRLAQLSTSDKIIGLSGMADGVDLWFCEICIELGLDYWSYIPFPEQDEYMSEEDKRIRKNLISKARYEKHLRNSFMVEDCDGAIIVWDGNKGGTHNCIQQLIETKKSFYWINPVNETVNYIK